MKVTKLLALLGDFVVSLDLLGRGPFSSLICSIMDEFMAFIVANMILIYFRDLVSIPTQFSSQIGRLLGLATSDDGLVEGLFPLFVT